MVYSSYISLDIETRSTLPKLYISFEAFSQSRWIKDDNTQTIGTTCSNGGDGADNIGIFRAFRSK